jgi:hypothetical protein
VSRRPVLADVPYALAALATFAGALPAQLGNLDWALEAVPPTRNGCVLVRHAAAGAAVLFGGLDGGYLADTWLWRDGWQRAAAANGPDARGWPAAAYDSLRQRIVLFGGRDQLTVRGDTWAFDGASWTQLAPPVSPSARHGAAMAYDAARDRIVMRGGLTSLLGNLVTELWEFDGATWQLVPQGGGDPGPNAGDPVFDAPRQETLWRSSSGLWAWNGAAWSQRSLAGLPAGAWGRLLYDDAGQRVLTVNPFAGGAPVPGVFSYQGAGWTQIGTVAPASQRGALMVIEPAAARVVAFELGGQEPDPRSHTWVLDGVGAASAAWRRAAAGLPPGRRDAAMAYDVARRRLQLHGGAQIVLGQDDLYEADDHAWTCAVPYAPGPRDHLAMAHDEARGVSLVFGGPGYPSFLRAWNGSAFTLLQPAAAPPGRWQHAMAYDALRQRTLVFGGEGVQPLLGDLWSWNGTAWTNVTTPGPSPRRETALAYDRGRDRLVLFGGVDATGVLGDTWEHDGSQWLLRTPATSPPARKDHVLVHATHLQRTVLVGGQDAQDLRDTWLWDGSDWQQLATAHQPDTGSGIAGCYDPDRREVVIFGGGTLAGSGTNRGELWRLRDVTLTRWSSTGSGCDAGNGPLAWQALDPPAIDTTCRIRLLNTPPSFVAFPFAWVGFDDQAWSGVPLPFSLAVLGAPACFVWADAQIALSLLPLGNHADGSMQLPDLPAAIGTRLFVQGVVYHFATGAVATADLLRAVVGPK